MKMDRILLNLTIKNLSSISLLLYVLMYAVTCTYADVTVRLVNTFDGATNKGRVEIYNQGIWGTICDDAWDIEDADVVCRQLGFTGAIQALNRAYFGAGDDPIWLDQVKCTGNESRIEDCQHNVWGVNDCVHIEDASVECSTATVRLVEGTDRYEGNVQILHNNEWGYVCDDEWDYDDANVTCNQLDGRGVDAHRIDSYYGTDSGKMWLSDVECSGYEQRLEYCPNDGWGNTNDCTKYNKAGAICTRDAIEDGAIRLAGTGDPYRGRVEIYHNGKWGTVCDDYWDYYDAKVVCRQLGYVHSQVKYYYLSYFGAGTGPIWKDNLACYGTEARLADCVTTHGWGIHDCSHAEDAGVYCDQRGVFDAGEITGIVLASIFGAAILLCCVKYICCEAATNKTHRRRRVGRQRSRPTTATTSNTPDEHFDAHFNHASTISDNQEPIFTPPGFPYPSPFSTDDLPPTYEFVIANPIEKNDNAAAMVAGASTSNAMESDGAALGATAMTATAAAHAPPSASGNVENISSPTLLPPGYSPRKQGMPASSSPVTPSPYPPAQPLPETHPCEQSPVQSTNQSHDQSSNQSHGQSTNQSHDQPTNQSHIQPAIEPMEPNAADAPNRDTPNAPGDGTIIFVAGACGAEGPSVNLGFESDNEISDA